MPLSRNKRDDTACVHHPVPPLDGFGSFAVPTYRASTIVFDGAAAYRSRAARIPDGYSYGLSGTPTTRVLEEQISRLHGGERSVIVPSGQAAITVLILTLLESGDHLLIGDNVYPPVKQFCREVLNRYGVTTTIYDPMDLDNLRASIGDRTRLIWIESPGSTTMEVSDVDGIVAIAKERGILTGCDNTWASPLLFKPLLHGVDVVAEAVTKYIGGHSDLLLGSLTFRDGDLYRRVRQKLSVLGIGVSPDDCSLALRGLETLAIRLERAGSVARAFAERLAGIDGVGRVLHPALPGAPGHVYWSKAFLGSSGVFSLQLGPCPEQKLDAALSQLSIFALGASWGGTRSLIVPMPIDREFGESSERQATYLRISIGLEDPGELWEDLEGALGKIFNRQSV
jgi:cystathionine beta-lyase